MRLVDPRRLTGPNLLDRRALALVDLGLDPGDAPTAVRDAYLGELAKMRSACGWNAQVEVHERGYHHGLLIGFSDPIDTLLASVEMAEWAALSACEVVAGREALPLEPKRTEIAAMIAAQRNPRLRALQDEAARRGLPFLWDDTQVSVGLGNRSRSWPLAELPQLEEIPWAQIGTIPVALITGTNGKTTCARLLARCAQEAGFRVGTTSTDGVTIDGAVIETGDMAGPIAARQVLRNRAIDYAVLETARGGIMRRGLAVEAADAALITNVSSDHLGDYGIDDVPSMAEVKGVVGHVVRSTGRVVLNARDPNLVALAPRYAAPVVFFSTDPEADAIRAHRAKGGECWVARDGWLAREQGDQRDPWLRFDEVPLTYGGAAVHNVENALAVAALASSMGLGREPILRALRDFHNREDNPRRGNVAEVGGVHVLLDFGHNPEGVRAALAFVRRLQGATPGRLAVITGHAGDRTEDDIAGVAAILREAKPDLVLIRDIEGYLRGRAPGEVPERFRQHLLALGMPEGAVRLESSEVAALRAALDWARPGDAVALLVYLDVEGDARVLEERGASYRI